MGMLLNKLVKRDSTRPAYSSDHAISFQTVIYQSLTSSSAYQPLHYEQHFAQKEHISQ